MTYEEIKTKVIDMHIDYLNYFDKGIRTKEEMEIILQLIAIIKNNDKPLTVKNANHILTKTIKIIEYVILDDITI